MYVSVDVLYGWRWSCWVSDDTGGVTPPTSASNLQHKKDTHMTLYLPPTILYPRPAPSARRCSLLFQLKSNSVSSCTRFLPQLAIKRTKEKVCVHFFCALILSLSQGFLSLSPTLCFAGAAYSFPFKVLNYATSINLLVKIYTLPFMNTTHFHVTLGQKKQMKRKEQRECLRLWRLCGSFQ